MAGADLDKLPAKKRSRARSFGETNGSSEARPYARGTKVQVLLDSGEWSNAVVASERLDR
jgi:hypothetical protein